MLKAHITGPLNKTRLGEAIAIELDMSYEDGIRAVEAAFDVIARTVAAGHSVTITNFGSFSAVHKPARPARNPKTGELFVIPPRQEVRFLRSDRLRAVVHAADPATATIRKHPKRTA